MCYSSNAFFVAFFYAQNDTELKDVKVSVDVKFIDNQTKAMQISQFELVLHKDGNWKIIE